MNSVTISWKLRLFMKVFKFMVFDCKIIMSLNTVPTNYHEFEYSKFSVFKLKFMTTGRIHASRCCEGTTRSTGGKERTSRARAPRDTKTQIRIQKE